MKRMSRLLLVEDDAMLLRALVRTLRRRIPVVTATNAIDALAILDAGDCIGILTDHDLEDRAHTGAWLLGQAKARHPKVRRILMTGNALLDRDEIERVAERVLLKPFPIETIVELLTNGSVFPKTA